MLSLIICALFTISQAQANFAETFGAHTTEQAIGNQADLNVQEAANNYYAPALLGFGEKLSFSISVSYVNSEFDDIKNITTKNSTNSNSSAVSDVSTAYQDFYHTSLHALFPVRSENKNIGSLGLSVMGPIGHVLESNSGDSTLPEYVMHRARYRRTTAYLNYAYPLSENWAFSLGTYIGFQVAAEVGTQVSLNGTTYGSSGKSRSKVSPSLAGVFSLAYKTQRSQTYFTFQQQMKSNLEAITSGEINDPASSVFEIEIQNLIYYDPYILRFGFGHELIEKRFELITSVEYQMWNEYKTPTVQIVDKGGVLLPSDDYERIDTRNIFVPRLGFKFHPSDNWTLSWGAFYRPTPLKGDFSGAGNSIDTNSIVGSLGLGYRFKFMRQEFQWSLAGQYHKLEERQVTKTAGQENGSAGNKIGAPGYSIGGRVIAASTGLNILF